MIALLGVVATLTLISNSDSRAHMELGDGSEIDDPAAGAEANGTGAGQADDPDRELVRGPA